MDEYWRVNAHLPALELHRDVYGEEARAGNVATLKPQRWVRTSFYNGAVLPLWLNVTICRAPISTTAAA